MEVQIRRREEISHLPTKVINESKVFLGSHFDGRVPLSGLTKEEEKKYLPQILGVSANHQDFQKEVREFWATMGFVVPMVGTVLDATVDEESGEPNNLEDWIKFKWCQKHKLVALSKEEMEKDPRKKFYIYNPEADAARANNKIQLMKKADAAFINTMKKGGVEKARRIIRILDVVNPDSLSDTQVENKLYELKQERPEDFLTIALDKNMDIKAEIHELINNEIFRRVGGQILYIDKVIGETINDAVAWYKDDKNSAVVADLKAKLKELKTVR